MISLGGVALPDGIQWVDQFRPHAVAQATARTIGGNLVVHAGGLTGGRPITLVAEENTAWIDQATLDGLFALANQPGEMFEFIHGFETIVVMFAHHDGPAIEVEPLWPGHGLFTGTIKLIEIV